MSDIPHTDILIEWLQDQTQEVWYLVTARREWKRTLNPPRRIIDYPGWQYELRPAKRELILPEARVPQHLTEAPGNGAVVWTIGFGNRGSGEFYLKWSGTSSDIKRLEQGAIWATREEAEAAFKAMTAREVPSE